ncbi:hypothetical protein ACKKBF_B35150 [Auxenochlorella protothecoides x Auxenochlorella symbiontica]
MPVGGKLVLKGGLHVGVEKKKKKKSKKSTKELTEEELATKSEREKAQGISVQNNNTYEQEFALEMQKAKAGKVKNTPWGSSYRAAPEILHGYDRKISGHTAEERLDMRVAIKTDKFCK